MKKIICSFLIIFLFNVILNAQGYENWRIRHSEQSENISVSFINIASDETSILVLMFTEDSLYITIFWGDEKYSKNNHSITYSFDKDTGVKVNGRQFAGYSLLYLDTKTEKKDASKFVDMLLKSKRLDISLISSENEKISTYFTLSGLQEAMKKELLTF